MYATASRQLSQRALDAAGITTSTRLVAKPKPVKPPKPVYAPKVTRESATTYTVPSCQYVYVLRTVTVDQGRSVSCTCEGNADWGKVCRHMKAVDAHMAAEAEAARKLAMRRPFSWRCQQCGADHYGFTPTGECSCQETVEQRPANVLPESRLTEKRDAVADFMACYR